nr:hypothetical protein [Candidatus Sigynarchaeum springense]
MAEKSDTRPGYLACHVCGEKVPEGALHYRCISCGAINCDKDKGTYYVCEDCLEKCSEETQEHIIKMACKIMKRKRILILIFYFTLFILGIVIAGNIIFLIMIYLQLGIVRLEGIIIIVVLGLTSGILVFIVFSAIQNRIEKDSKLYRQLGTTIKAGMAKNDSGSDPV